MISANSWATFLCFNSFILKSFLKSLTKNWTSHKEVITLYLNIDILQTASTYKTFKHIIILSCWQPCYNIPDIVILKSFNCCRYCCIFTTVTCISHRTGYLIAARGNAKFHHIFIADIIAQLVIFHFSRFILSAFGYQIHSSKNQNIKHQKNRVKTEPTNKAQRKKKTHTHTQTQEGSR